MRSLKIVSSLFSKYHKNIRTMSVVSLTCFVQVTASDWLEYLSPRLSYLFTPSKIIVWLWIWIHSPIFWTFSTSVKSIINDYWRSKVPLPVTGVVCCKFLIILFYFLLSKMYVFFKFEPTQGSKCWVTGWGKDAFLQEVNS